MRIIPAIDLKDGKCVRLLKGDFEQTTEYSSEPAEVAERFASLQVTDLHVVDLDGARAGVQRNRAVVMEIVRGTPLGVQLGGGLRSEHDVESWLEAGVARCVIGSLAVTEPDKVKSWISKFGGERIVLAFDVKISDGTPYLATHGWTRRSEFSLWDALDTFAQAGLEHVLCTDVSRDGALTGPNIALYREVLAQYPDLGLQASGGVRNLDDLVALSAAGLPAAITGRAMLDGRISAAEVASFQRNA